MGGVDAAVENCDADAFAGGGVPWAVGGAAGDVVAVAAYLADGPALRRVVIGVWIGGGRLIGVSGVSGVWPNTGTDGMDFDGAEDDAERWVNLRAKGEVACG